MPLWAGCRLTHISETFVVENFGYHLQGQLLCFYLYIYTIDFVDILLLSDLP